MISEATRKTIELRLEKLATCARLIELLKKEILVELDIASSEVWIDGEAEFPLGQNFDIFIANFNNSAKVDASVYVSMVKDWQLKTMEFNKETGEWK